MKFRVAAAGGLVAILAASAFAQPPGGGRGFGRGFGGMPQSGVMLLSMEEVRTELDTTADQDGKIEELSEDVRSKMREAFGDFQSLQNLSEQDRAARMAESRTKAEAVGKEADAKLAEILKPEQLDRLNQLRLQRDGVMALGRSEVAEQLGLSQEQKDQVAKILEAGRRQDPPRNFREMSEEERNEFFAEMRERREKTESELLAVLNDEQKKAWEGLQGEKFAFPERRGGR